MSSFERFEKWLAIGAGGFCIVVSLSLEVILLLPLDGNQIERMEKSRDSLWERGLMLGFGTGASAAVVSAIAKGKRRNTPPGDEISLMPDLSSVPDPQGWLDALEQQPPLDENIQILMSQGYSYQEAEQIMRQPEYRSPGE